MSDTASSEKAGAWHGDYSCTVPIHNQTGETLTLLAKKDYHGYWSDTPPDQINGYSTVPVKIKDYTGPAGSEGYMRYKHPNGAEICMSFACPTNASNKATIHVEGSGSIPVSVQPAHVDPQGHPVNADYYIG